MPEDPRAEAHVFFGGGARPNARFQALCGLAGIKPRLVIETGEEEPWELNEKRSRPGPLQREVRRRRRTLIRSIARQQCQVLLDQLHGQLFRVIRALGVIVVVEPADSLVEQFSVEFDHFLDGVVRIQRSESLLGQDAVPAVKTAAVRELERHMTTPISVGRQHAHEIDLLAESCVPSFAKGDGKTGAGATIDARSSHLVTIVRVDFIPQPVQDRDSIRPQGEEITARPGHQQSQS